MHTAISEILGRCGTDSSVLPPTQLYNEGWLLRLVLDWLDRHRGFEHPLSFMSGARWYSEALLPSRFMARTRGDKLAETFTHADGLIGHFNVASGVRGDAKLRGGAEQLIVIEAKLGSALSGGTKNALDYDQAARNVACIAHMLAAAQIRPHTIRCLGFYVLAPRSQIDSGVFAELVTKPSVQKKVLARAEPYVGAHDVWFEQWFLPTVERIKLGAMSWEAVLDALPADEEAEQVRAFYGQCLRFNPLRIGKGAPGPVPADAAVFAGDGGTGKACRLDRS